MSLILDALNRSRQNENAVPGLATQHPVEQLSAQRRQYLLWGALAIAALVIAVLVIDRFRTPPAPEADIGAPVAELSRNIGSAVNSVTTELKARAAAAEQAQAAAPASATTVEPAAAPPPVAQPAATPVPPAPPAAVAPAAAQTASATEVAAPEPPAENSVAAAPPPQSSPAAVRDAAVEKLYQNRDLEDEPATQETASPTSQRRVAEGDSRVQHSAEVDRILREARDEMENASLEDHPAPFLADLSQRTKDNIPTLYYQRHDYSSNAAQSSVTLNGNTVKAGGSPLPGMKVEEILPDSVVLNYQGTQFRLRALNSWVNL